MRFAPKKYDKVVLFFFAAFIAGAFFTWIFEERFNEKGWRSNRSMRYKMADDIIDSDLLIGKSKEDIIDLLGVPYDTNLFGKDNIAYRLGRPPSFSQTKHAILIIDFKLGHAVQVIESSE